MPRRADLTLNQKLKLIAAYREGACVTHLCEQFRCGRVTVFRVLRWAAVPVRAQSPNEVPDPTPEQLLARRDAIRDSWTEKTERQRRGASDESYEFPVTRVLMPGPRCSRAV